MLTSTINTGVHIIINTISISNKTPIPSIASPEWPAFLLIITKRIIAPIIAIPRMIRKIVQNQAN